MSPINKKIVVGVAIVIIIIAAIAGYLAFIAPPPAPPKPEKIYVGMALCLTGPWAAPAKDAYEGLMSFFKMVNEEYGGVKGIPIEVIVEDNEYKPDVSIKIFTKWRETYELSFLITCGSHVVAALYPLVEEAKIPYTDPSAQGIWANASRYPWYFNAPIGSYTDQQRAVLKWFKETQFKEARAPRLAIVYETKAFGKPIMASAKEYAEYLGYEVHTEVVEIGATSAYEQVERIKAFRPDLVIILEPPKETAIVIKNAIELGLKTQFAGFYYAVYYEPALKALGPLVEGILLGAPVVPFGYPAPGMDQLKAALKKYFGREDGSSMHVYGWLQALIVYKALEASLEMYGDVKPEHVKDALEKIEIDAKGLHFGPIKYTSKDHRSTTNYWIWQVKDGRWVRVGEVILPREDPWFGK